MLKLRNIINSLVLEAMHLSLNDILIIGMIDYGDHVKSTKVTTNATHNSLGYRQGINWRYNPTTKIVYWWDMDDIGKFQKQEVEKHLLTKYKFEVLDHKPMIINPSFDDDSSGNPDDDEQYYRNMDTHPFGRGF